MKKLKTNPYGWPDKITAGNRANKIQIAKKGKNLSKALRNLRPRRVPEGYISALEYAIFELGLDIKRPNCPSSNHDKEAE